MTTTGPAAALSSSIINNAGHPASSAPAVAVKCLNKPRLSPEALLHQRQEAQLLSTLKHNNVIGLLDLIDAPLHLFMVQHQCDYDLFEAIQTCDGGKMSEQRIKGLFGQVCSAVAYCHSMNVFHRDLKPENILISVTSDSKEVVKLTDFGLATKNQLSDEFGCGTHRYMSPECYTGKGKRGLALPYYCPANDVWALGVILINLLTAQNPWNAPSRDDAHFNCHIMAARSKTSDTFMVQFNFALAASTLLRQVFDLDPFRRPTASDLKALASWECSLRSVVPVANHGGKFAMSEFQMRCRSHIVPAAPAPLNSRTRTFY